MKEKKNKLNFGKIKNFYFKRHCWKYKRRVIDWEKIFENHMSDKEHVQKLCKELSKCNKKKINNPIKKSRRFKQMLHQRRYMGSK